MTQKVTITVKKRPKPQQGSNQPKRGRINLATPSKRPTRRRLQKGIRFFDLGVIKVGNSWNTFEHTLEHTPTPVWQRLIEIGQSNWKSLFRPITADLNASSYNLVTKDDYEPVGDLGTWNGDRFNFSDEGFSLVINKDLYDRATLWRTITGDVFPTSSVLLRTTFAETTIVTNSPNRPESIADAVEFTPQKDANWYLLPIFTYQVGGFDVGPVTQVFRMNEPASLRAVTPRVPPIEYSVAEYVNSETFENIIDPITHHLASLVLANPYTTVTIDGDVVPKPSSLPAAYYGMAMFSSVWLPPEADFYPLMVVEQSGQWFYFWSI